MVMRDGKPCGLNKMSGVMPDSVKGMSSAGHSRESTPRGHVSDPSRTRPGHVLRGRKSSTPFWPWRDENLSPGMGLRL